MSISFSYRNWIIIFFIVECLYLLACLNFDKWRVKGLELYILSVKLLSIKHDTLCTPLSRYGMWNTGHHLDTMWDSAQDWIIHITGIVTWRIGTASIIKLLNRMSISCYLVKFAANFHEIKCVLHLLLNIFLTGIFW